MCQFIWGWIYTKLIVPRDTRGALVGFRGSTIQRYGKLSDWHQLWFTSADSSGNGHSLNTSRPSIPRGHLGGGRLGCHKFKSLGKLSNGWTDRHQIWHTSADPSGNGYTPNNLPLEAQGGGGLGVNIQKSGEAVKRLYRLAPTLVHVCGYIWEWT